MPSTPDGGEWSVSRPKAFCRLLLGRRLGGPYTVSGDCREERNLLQPPPPPPTQRIESRFLNTKIGREI